jgi:hypothetical protein
MMSDEGQMVRGALAALMGELVDGAGKETAWVLNPEDPGLLRSLDKLSAAEASSPAPGVGAPIAPHVEHLRYGLELLLRWSRGEDPFKDANYGASWRQWVVSEPEWKSLRDRLGANAHAWLDVLRQPRTVTESELTAIVASVVHLAYHLGAIRQIDRSTRGPAARD